MIYHPTNNVHNEIVLFMLFNNLLSTIYACTNIMLTSVIDVHPLEEFALIRDAVKLAALDRSETGLALSAWLLVTDLVSAALPEAVSPSILWAEGHKRKEISLY